jgi:hypothetical protein
LAEAGIDGHLDIAIAVADEDGIGEVEMMIAAGGEDHIGIWFGPIGVVSLTGEGVDGVEGGAGICELRLHALVDIVDGLFRDKAFADAALARDNDRLILFILNELKNFRKAGSEVKLIPGEDITGARGAIDDAIAVEEYGGFRDRQGAHFFTLLG